MQPIKLFWYLVEVLKAIVATKMRLAPFIYKNTAATAKKVLNMLPITETIIPAFENC
jgi:hypothetical protein